MRVPAAAIEVAEDDQRSSVGGDDLPVAASQRRLRPPAILDQPGLAYGFDIAAVHAQRTPAPARAHARGCRLVQPLGPAHVSHGASTSRRSGTRDSGSTSSTRNAASGPAAARAWRIASRRRPVRAVAGPVSSAPRAPAGGPKTPARRPRTPAGAGRGGGLGA